MPFFTYTVKNEIFENYRNLDVKKFQKFLYDIEDLNISKKAILVEDVDSLNLNIFEDINNIGITASASSPEILVEKLLNKLKDNFELKINEAHYQKEDIYFKVPQSLKN